MPKVFLLPSANTTVRLVTLPSKYTLAFLILLHFQIVPSILHSLSSILKIPTTQSRYKYDSPSLFFHHIAAAEHLQCPHEDH